MVLVMPVFILVIQGDRKRMQRAPLLPVSGQKVAIFFSLTEAPLPDPTQRPKTDPKQTRNGPETDPNGPKTYRNGPKMDRNQALWGGSERARG